MNLQHVAGLVLAGGQGSRMGGADKGLVVLDGRPMVAHVIERLAPQVGRLLINANRNAADYAGFGVPVLPDRVAGFVGPLAGLDAGLHAIEPPFDWVATCPCDSPFLPHDLVARLYAAAEAGAADVAMARADGQEQPVFLLAHRRAAPALAAYLAGGGRGVGRWVSLQAHVIVDFDDCPQAFVNINTPEELARHARAADG